MDNMIEFGDDGQKVLLPRTTYRSEVLPRTLHDCWDKPDELAFTIQNALAEGFYSEVEEAAKRLVDIDDIPERAICLYGIVLIHTQRYSEAEQCFFDYLRAHPSAPYVLTNLAKAQDFLGKKVESLITLEESISLDPDQENALSWWIHIKVEEFESQGLIHKQAHLNALELANNRFGGWRSMLWLGEYYADAKDKVTARKYYEAVLKEEWGPDALTSISGTLGRNGFAEDAIELVIPCYDPQQHDVMTGINLLQAYLELKQISEGQLLLKQLLDIQHPGLQEQLAWYQSAFLDTLNSLNTSSSKGHLNITSVSLDFPLWCYGWNIKHGFESEKTGKKIAFLQFAWEPEQQLKKINLDTENPQGRLARAIPLYLLEDIYYWTDASATFMFPINEDTGEYILYEDVPNTQNIISLSNQGYDGVITGTIASDELEVIYWDLATGHPMHQNFRFNLGNPHQTIPHIEEFIFETAGIPFDFSCKNSRKNYQRIPLDRLDGYLLRLSQHLTLYLATQFLEVANRMYAETDMIQGLFEFAMNTVTLQTQLNMLSVIHKCMRYNSKIIRNYKSDILKWLQQLVEITPSLRGMAKKTADVFQKYCEY